MIQFDVIYNENCIDTMSRMQNDSVDMIMTSPPYDNLRNYNGYSFEFESIARELFRILKPGRVLIWVVGDKTNDGSESGTSFRQALYFKDVIGFKLWDTQIYRKNNPVPTIGNRYHQEFEYMFVLSKGNVKVFNPITVPTKYRGIANMKNRGKDGSRDYRKIERTTMKKIGNVFSYNVGFGHSTSDRIAFDQPAIFPEKLVEDQIITWSNSGELIYDPMIGSGTTAKIAKKLARRYIGSEISTEYCNIANERVDFITNDSEYF